MQRFVGAATAVRRRNLDRQWTSSWNPFALYWGELWTGRCDFTRTSFCPSSLGSKQGASRLAYNSSRNSAHLSRLGSHSNPKIATRLFACASSWRCHTSCPCLVFSSRYYCACASTSCITLGSQTFCAPFSLEWRVFFHPTLPYPSRPPCLCPS